MQRLQADPVGGVLEPCCVQDEGCILPGMVAPKGTEVAVPCTPQELSPPGRLRARHSATEDCERPQAAGDKALVRRLLLHRSASCIWHCSNVCDTGIHQNQQLSSIRGIPTCL